ncbi:iron ABC transporter substrate-binding protein [Enterococcus sp. JM4C]|uniref:siderophore ABC transporter substrate-binding protein n=1 Tax=Candidatus Enterococcus huntleyi TaxID=1857217 RepID=UPI00137A9744|nr:siderophore ABC transporter substrate-binding protein [Enterococcus sp. JM4C]KAF1297900.1 iron ABC transporter substrate-binding protein [Enterococcus sp. JM4C]
MKKKLLAGLAVAALSMVLVACGNGDKGKTAASGSEAASSESAQSSSEATPKTIEVEDSNGKVTVPTNPKKVVVFDNGSLDTIDALGAGDAVVGAAVDNLPTYLDKYTSVESAGGLKEPDLEKINQLQPDLIIISGRQRDFMEDLSKIAPTLFLAVDNENTWASIQQNVTTLGKIFGKETEAADALASLDKEIAATKEKAEASGSKALVVLANEGQLSAYGQGSRFGIVHDTFGFAQADDQIEASTHGQSVSFEYVLEKNPDILFVVDRTKAVGGDDSQNNLTDNELVKQTTAGKNDKVIQLSPDTWYLSGGGLESVHLMLEDVNNAF